MGLEASNSYLYSIDGNNFVTSNEFTNLSAGIYTIYVQDANEPQVQSTCQAEVMAPAELTLDYELTPMTCASDFDASIDLIVSGGSAPYQYDWSTGATTQDIGNLAAGDYTVEVTDNKGCKATMNITIEAPRSITILGAAFGVNCADGADGRIDLNITGGLPPYDISAYNWTTGTTTQELTNLSASLYTVFVSDANGCVETGEFTIRGPEPINVLMNIVDVSCFGEQDGRVEMEITGGTGAFRMSAYNWETGETYPSLDNLGAGNYTIIISDENICIKTYTLRLDEPELMDVSFTTGQVSCNGATDGSIDVTVRGGTGSYTYNWSNGATTPDLTNVGAGTYSCEITDESGCVETIQATIFEPDPIIIDVRATDISCAGANDGKINLTISDGIRPYTYQWSTGQTSQDLSNLSAGQYTVLVTDGNGCQESATVSIAEPNALTLSLVPTDISCFNAFDGSIAVQIGGGVTPYAYSWSTGATTQNLNGLGATSYSLSVTDGNGCLITASATINEPAELVCQDIVPTDASRLGATDGQIALTVVGGTAPYSYTWSNGENTQNLTNIGAGSYTVTITDDNGCETICGTTVNEPSEVFCTVSSTPISCEGADDGIITVNGSGGSGTYEYSLDGVNFGAQNVFTSLEGGIYTIYVRDLLDPTITSTCQATVIEPDALRLVVTQIDVTCHEANDGMLDLRIIGGTPPFTYRWSNGTTAQDAINLRPGTYGVTVTDGNGCVQSAISGIGEPEPLTATFDVESATCFGDADGNIDLTVSGGRPPYSYRWSNGETTKDMSGLNSGTYTVEITDFSGCTLVESVSLTQPSAIVVTPNITKVSCFGENDGKVDVEISGGVGPYRYQWSNGATSQDLNNVRSGTYTIVVTDFNGCTQSAQAVVEEPNPISISVQKQDVLCNGGNGGNVTLSISGGNRPYEITWSNGETGNRINNLEAGSYFARVVDGEGCDASVNVIIEEPAPITIELVNKQCNDNGTPSDANDDMFTYEVVVRRGNLVGTWVADDGTTGTYNERISFGPFAIADGVSRMTFRDGTNTTCREVFEVTPPRTCSNACDIDVTLLSLDCNNNGTPVNPQDDIFYFTVRIDGANTSSGWLTNDGVRGQYGDEVEFGPFQINGSEVLVYFTDNEAGKCITPFRVAPPAHCSELCNIAANIVNVACDDGGTPANPLDDYFTAIIEVDGPSDGWVGTSEIGSVSGAYRQQIEVGPFENNGQPITIEIADNAFVECSIPLVINPSDVCQTEECTMEALISNVTRDDRGTPGDPFDDFVSFDLMVNSTNSSGVWTWNHNNTDYMGVYNEIMGIKDLPINGLFEIQMNIVDRDNAACQTVSQLEVPLLECEIACNIEAAIQNIALDVNQGNDVSDDMYRFDLLVTNGEESGTWHIDLDGQRLNGSFGDPKAMGPFDIKDGVLRLEIVSDASGQCMELVTFAPPIAYFSSENEAIQAIVSNVQCLDNGTPGNTSDDRFTFDVMVVGQPGTASWTASDPERTMGQYLTGRTFGPYPASAGAVEFIIFDDEILSEGNLGENGIDIDPHRENLFTRVRVAPPTDCLNECALSITDASTLCQDNQTPADNTDDEFYVTLSVVNDHAEGFEWIATVNGLEYTGYYGIDTDIGPFQNTNNDVVISVRDAITGGCVTQTTVTAPVISPVTDNLVAYCPDVDEYCDPQLVDQLVVPTNPYSCTATFEVPLPDLYNTCGDQPTVVTEILDQQGLMVHTIADGESRTVVGLNIGTYSTRYTVTNSCGDESIVNCPFVVVDREEPIVIAAESVSVSLNGLSSKVLEVADIDAGSFDNCGIQEMKIRRNYTHTDFNCGEFESPTYSEWGPTVSLGCCDLGKLVQVELLVEDVNGNRNISWVEIMIEEQCEIPVCTDLDTIYFACADLPAGFNPEDKLDLKGLFGTSTMSNGACQANAIELEPIVEVSDCCSGRIERRFVTMGAHGDVWQDTCTQIIYLEGDGNVESDLKYGEITTAGGSPIQGVSVTITGPQAVPTATTDATGRYEFTVQQDGNYIADALLDSDHGNGLTEADVIALQKHVLGIETITSPYLLIAADVDNNQRIDNFDIFALQDVVQGNTEAFQNNTSWRFVDRDYEFPDPLDPWFEQFPETIELVFDCDGSSNGNFVGIKVGDLDDSAITAASPDGIVETRSMVGTFDFDLTDATIEAGTTHDIEFRAEELAEIEGYQFGLDINPAYATVEQVNFGIAKESDFNLDRIKDGEFTNTWSELTNRNFSDSTGQAPRLFTLRVKAKQTIKVSELLRITPRMVNPEAYDTNGQDRSLGLRYLDVEGVAEVLEFDLYQNRPNPFLSETTIGFVLPQAGEAQFLIHGTNGQLIKSIQGTFEAGYNEIHLKGSELPEGVLYYTLETDDFRMTKKMTVIK